MVRALAQSTIEERFSNDLQIFTDGSKMRNSTAAGLWIPEMNYKEGWKLEDGDNITIMSAEFLAITKALEWATLNGEFLDKKELVILTDSMSSLEALKSTSTSKYSAQEEHANRISEILHDNGFSISLQWVPSHVGLTGNEVADKVAKESHTLPTLTPCPLSTEEAKRVVKRAASTVWQMIYNTKIDDLHIGEIKCKSEQWPWAQNKCRAIETAMSIMRIGHVELNAYLHRFGQTDSHLCPQCRVPETVSHYLLECRRYMQSRIKLYTTLNKAGVHTFNKKNLLGGGDFPPNQQLQIAKAMETFLRESSRLYGLTTL